MFAYGCMVLDNSCMWLRTAEYVCFIWSHMVQSGLMCLHKVACHSIWLYMVTIVCIWLVAIGYRWLVMDAYGALCLHVVAYGGLWLHSWTWLQLVAYY